MSPSSDTTPSESYRIMPQVIKDTSFTVIRQTAKSIFMASTLLFYLLQKPYHNRSCIFFQYLLPFIILYSKLHVATPAPTWHNMTQFIPSFINTHTHTHMNAHINTQITTISPFFRNQNTPKMDSGLWIPPCFIHNFLKW